jgi:hypothetical protein
VWKIQSMKQAVSLARNYAQGVMGVDAVVTLVVLVRADDPVSRCYPAHLSGLVANQRIVAWASSNSCVGWQSLV